MMPHASSLAMPTLILLNASSSEISRSGFCCAVTAAGTAESSCIDRQVSTVTAHTKPANEQNHNSVSVLLIFPGLEYSA